MPTSMIAAISSDVATGRRIKSRDGFMLYSAGRPRASPAIAPLLLTLSRLLPLPVCLWRVLTRLSRGLPGRRGDVGRGAVLEPVGSIGDDDRAGIEPLGHRHLLAIARAERHGLHAHRVVRLDQVDEGPRRAALDRRARHDAG